MKCKDCKYFRSFREDYHDHFEPDEYGFCNHPENEIDRAGTGEGCDLFSARENGHSLQMTVKMQKQNV